MSKPIEAKKEQPDIDDWLWRIFDDYHTAKGQDDLDGYDKAKQALYQRLAAEAEDIEVAVDTDTGLTASVKAIPLSKLKAIMEAKDE